MALLKYLQERIAKIEELYDEGVEDEIEEEVQDEVEEESLTEAEPLAETVPALEETVSADEEVCVERSLESDVRGPVLDVVVEQEVVVANVERVEAEVQEVVSQDHELTTPFVPEKIEPEHVLRDILETSSFSSQANKRLFEKNLPQLLNGTARERELSLSQIAHFAGKDVLRKVYAFAMKDESSTVRLAVVKNITRMKDGEGDGLFELGLNDPDEKVRTAAVKGIGSHVCEKHREILEMLLKDPDPHVRALAVTYLGIYYTKDGARKAILCWTDESPYVRVSLLEMLSIVKPDGALTIIKNLLTDKDAEVKSAAQKALQKLMPERKKGKGYGERKK